MMEITKDLLLLEYCQNNLSEAAISKKYNISIYKLNKLFNEYNIQKNVSLNDNKAHDKLKNLTIDIFFELYTNQNKSYKEIAELYGATERQVKRLNVEKYHCKRNASDKNKNIQTALKKVSTTLDYKQLNENRAKAVFAKYGVENVFQLDSVKQKIKQTNLEKYGAENPMLNIDIRQKVSDSLRKTFDKSFNRDSAFSDIVSSSDKLYDFILNINEDERTFYNIAKKLNYSVSYITHKIQEYNLNQYIKYQTNTSHYEQEISDYLTEIGITKEDIIHNCRNILENKELDIYIPTKKVAIEFNGDYWHTVDKVGKKYHYEKSKAAEDNGIRLIHVYEYQWTDPIKQLILKSIIRNALGLNQNKIYARNCEVRELQVNDVREFSELNSLHGHRNAEIYLGLFYKDELVELMSFGHPFFARNDSIDYECIRSITKINYTVIGGMNKLFQYFINTYKPNKILYYVDYNTHNGSSMDKLGFVFYKYSKGGIINISNDDEITKKYGYCFNRIPMNNNLMKQLKEDNKINTIYDAGVKRYMWTAKEVK